MKIRRPLGLPPTLIGPALAAALFVLAGGCGSDRTERTGRTERVGGPKRIVSLAPNVTEILFRVGAGDRLVGATDQCNEPPEAERIARVGSFGRPSVEKLLAIAPDVVVAVSGGLERSDTLAALRGAGIQVVEVRIGGFEELFEAVRRIGVAVDRTSQAEDVVRAMRAELESVAARRAAKSDAPRLKVFIEIADRPLMTAGGASFLDELIVLAGGVNAAHEIAQPYAAVAPEKVIEWNPDVIVAPRTPDGRDIAGEMGRRIGWTEIAAVKRGWIITDIHPDLLLRPGPRLIDGVKAMADRLRTMEGRP